ncbi:hypothetical protein [Caulobacter sp.]|uniref:hypothetical protein n=1 Tax=Caulobacter sp. TaxID=78 RepID=UPI002B4634A7|nr:hypothetical protein [Caulobacter sp.]HJV41441.1 hypothetical protein [Caulobacter sp.]
MSGPIGLIAGLEPLSRALNWVAITLDLGWIWSVYTVSVAALPERPRAAWIPYVFAAPPIIDAVTLVFGLSMNNSPTAFLFFAAFLFCIGQTAMVLEEADRGGAPGSLGKTLGTALLLFFSIVGLWWLRQRLLRIAARTPQI